MTETQRLVAECRQWSLNLMDRARDNGVALWLKNKCFEAWPDLQRRQEWTEGMVG